jgi:hypothetical protein
MRKRRRLLLAGAFAVACVAGGLAWWVLHTPRVTDTAYVRIDIGLSLAEVEGIIGGRPGNYGGGPKHEYLPRSLLCAGPVLTVLTGIGNVAEPGDLGWLVHTDSVTDGFMPVQSWAPAVRRTLSMKEYQALRRPARTVAWTGLDYAIAVQLDDEDRVVNACLAKSFREPGLLERLLDRIGIK